MESEDSRNSSSSDNSSDESAEGPSFIDCEGAQPYLFEPYDSDASSGTDSSNDSGERQYERLQNTDWWAINFNLQCVANAVVVQT